jgi:uncharacterized protein (DUF1330 family)
MTTYLVAHFNIHTPAEYSEYRDKFFPIFENAGGTARLR